MSIRRVCLAAPLLFALALVPAMAAASLSFDVETLNRILPALSASRVEVPITAGRSLIVEIHDMEVVGFEPGTDGAAGRIATRLRVVVPQLGLEVALEPKLLLEIVEREGRSELELRFDEVELAIPLAGKVDLASMLPAMRFPTQNMWRVQGATGDVAVRSRVVGLEMDRSRLRFEFELDTVEGGSD